MPPATAKFALAFESDGDTIHPPPVTKSPAVASHGGGDTGQVMSACAWETITSASGGPLGVVGLLTTTCRALTSIVPDWPLTELDCSLIVTLPASRGSWIVWLVAPETSMR